MFFVFSYWFTAVGLPGCSHFGLQLVRVVLLVPKSLLRWSPDLQWRLQTRTRTTFTYCSPRWWSWCSSAGSQSLRRLSSKHFANENICLDKCIKFSLIKNTCRNHCDVYQCKDFRKQPLVDPLSVLQVAEVSHLDDEIMALHSEIVELQRSPYARRQGDKMEQLWVLKGFNLRWFNLWTFIKSHLNPTFHLI